MHKITIDVTIDNVKYQAGQPLTIEERGQVDPAWCATMAGAIEALVNGVVKGQISGVDLLDSDD